MMRLVVVWMMAAVGAALAPPHEVFALAQGDGKQNVLGQPLASCSTGGMATTGFTRSGKCEDEGDDDAGSHHICTVMKSDFCTVTGQPDWCTQPMDGKNIVNWCICQWAYASYLAKKGDCANSLDLKCDAVNMAAIRAYEAKASTDPEIKSALACLKQKCPNAGSL